MVRVIMHGCNGRMGQVITEMIAKEAEMEIVAGVDLSDHIQNSYPVFKSMKDCNVEADVVIDFANAKAVDGPFFPLNKNFSASNWHFSKYHSNKLCSSSSNQASNP